jgi:hypothetical protein
MVVQVARRRKLIRGHVMLQIFRVLPAAILSTVCVTSIADTVHAAPPGNDTQAGAVVITGVPFTHTQDTTEATVDAGEDVARDFCLGIGAPAFENAVWFVATVSGGGTDAVLFDTSQSGYGAGIAVLQDIGGTLTPLACLPRAFLAAPGAPAGTYYFVVFGDGTTPATGGTLTFTAEVPTPPPAVEVTINPVATATKEGGVLVSGTVSCTSNDSTAVVVSINGQISQTVGRFIITSFFFASPNVPCDGGTYPWQAYAPPTNGKFSGGKAATIAFATACNSAQCSQGFTEAVIKLTRGRG